MKKVALWTLAFLVPMLAYGQNNLASRTLATSIADTDIFYMSDAVGGIPDWKVPFSLLRSGLGADTALQPGDNISTLINNSGYLTSVEGTAILSTGELGGTKFLRENGAGGASWITIAGGGDALTANPLSQFAATTSLQLLGVMSDETGTGSLVFNTSPTLVTPLLGTPASGIMTNVTGTASGLTAGTVTTNANLTGEITSIGNAASLGSFTVASLNTAISDATLSGNNTGDQINITGNAATVTTNANLTGIITSVGNATAIADKALAIAKLADGTDGELITWSALGVIETIAVGTATHVLTSNGIGLAPTFQAAAGGASPLTTKGDLYTYDTGDQRLAIGANTFVLTADSAEATGIKWAAATGGGIAAVVDDLTPQLGGDLDFNGFDIRAFAPGSDIATADRVVEGQSAWVSATVNTSAGNLDLKMGDHATAGGTAGLVRILAPDDTVAFSIDELGNLEGKIFVSRIADNSIGFGRGIFDGAASGIARTVVIGNDALKSALNPDNIVVIGTGALENLTLGMDGSVVIGEDAADSAINASGASANVIIGQDAGGTGTWAGANSNTIIGQAVAINISSGDSNTIVGSVAADDLTVGSLNSIYGKNAANGLTSANKGVFLGANVPIINATDDYQFVVGINAQTLAVPAISGYFGADVDVDMSGKSLTISGPSAYKFSATNIDGGNLVLQAGQLNGGGVNGLTLVNDTAYGIMSVQAGVTSQDDIGTTPEILVAWNTDGLAHGTTVSHANDYITVSVAGTYEVSGGVSFGGTGGSLVDLHLYVYDDSGASWGDSGFHTHRKLGTGGDVGSAVLPHGLVALDVNDRVALYVTTDGATDDITVSEAQMIIKRISN